MQPYSKLRVVDATRTMIKATYAFTRSLPNDEKFGLSSQMRRAAISVGLNIVEGSSRPTIKDFLRFLETARGSGMELHFAIVVSADLELGRPALRERLAQELDSSLRQLSALIAALRKRALAHPRR
jgi:four helix bundle protein